MQVFEEPLKQDWEALLMRPNFDAVGITLEGFERVAGNHKIEKKMRATSSTLAGLLEMQAGSEAPGRAVKASRPSPRVVALEGGGPQSTETSHSTTKVT